MTMKKAIILAISFFYTLHSLADTLKPLEGFKQIKFGASSTELFKLGINCINTSSVPCNLTEKSPNFTFLNQPIRKDDSHLLQIWLSQDEPHGVELITFYVNLNSSLVSAKLTESLGKPLRLWDRDYWFFSNKGAIATYNPDSARYPARLFYFAPNNPELVTVKSHFFRAPIKNNDY